MSGFTLYVPKLMEQSVPEGKVCPSGFKLVVIPVASFWTHYNIKYQIGTMVINLGL